ncbi:hypothetical protein [Planotetraspora mira]|uniref:Uncharacterized protein n=1 Tax=Planotetraspora mira TaxID=58121 RepID=A0A8J3X5R6_9ACTN|nr:hypothetical protein [Planotetraspora mira]GII28446.1 hypothetical protein Pmi06nite_18880 [Planotetraspora mira]
MAVLLGDKHRFAVEVGEWVGPALRRVDLWVADQWLTCDDNAVFVAQFRLSVAATADRVRSGGGLPLAFAVSPVATHQRLVDATRGAEEDYGRFWIFNDWGPTTDNVLAFLFRDGDQLLITSEFWREDHLSEHPEHAGRVFVAELQAGEFVGILEELVAVLDHD